MRRTQWYGRAAVWVALGAVASCTGRIDDPGRTEADPSERGRSEAIPGAPGEHSAACEGDPNDATSLAMQPIRRLSETEYHNTVRDLFEGVAYEPTELVPALTSGGFENFVSNTRQVGLRDVEAFDTTVEGVAARASADAAFLARHGCSDPSRQGTCISRFVEQFGLRGLRRPLRGEEQRAFRQLAEETAALTDLAGGIETIIAAVLMTPEFLYRVEQRGQTQASPYEIASRLSYLLWQTMPDDSLFAAAAAGELSTPAQLETQARRMLADARATEAMADFHRQWFRFARMDEDKYNAKSPTLFPEWTPALRAAIHEEVRRFVLHIAEQDTTLHRLLTDRTAYVTPEIAELYGTSADAGGSEVELPADERGGILTRANFLAGTGIAGHGSPVHRGIFVYENLLCGHLGGVPDDVDTSLPEDAPPDQTTRELYEELTSPPECQVCHAAVNPIGFTFEHYTSTGAYRTMENGRAIDSSGAIPSEDESVAIAGAVELSERLAESEAAHACTADKWTTYALGRRLDATSQADSCYAERIRGAFLESGGDMRELLATFVTQPEFLGGAQ